VQDHLKHRWWAPDELGAFSALFYPQSLPLHIAALAAGQAVDEPLEVWEELN
jgi:hypothetical protein